MAKYQIMTPDGYEVEVTASTQSEAIEKANRIYCRNKIAQRKHHRHPRRRLCLRLDHSRTGRTRHHLGCRHRRSRHRSHHRSTTTRRPIGFEWQCRHRTSFDCRKRSDRTGWRHRLRPRSRAGCCTRCSCPRSFESYGRKTNGTFHRIGSWLIKEFDQQKPTPMVAQESAGIRSSASFASAAVPRIQSNYLWMWRVRQGRQLSPQSNTRFARNTASPTRYVQSQDTARTVASI